MASIDGADGPGVSGSVLVTAVGVVVLAVVGWPGWWHAGGVRPAGTVGDLLATGELAALLVWRRWPAGCFAVAEAAAVSYGLLGFPATPSGYAGLVATAVVAWRAPRATLRYASLAIAAAGVVVIGTAGPRPAGVAAVVANLLLVCVAWLVGIALRSRQAASASSARLDQERARRQATEDRLGLAEALHDRVGHALVGVLRQLEAAQTLRASASPAGDAMIARSVERLRDALGEVSTLVVSEQLVPRSPYPRTAVVAGRRGMLGEALGHWVGLLAAAGISVHLSVSGDAASLPDAVEVAIAGLVAEGLANVAAHSAAPEVTVSLQLGAEDATVAISDPGPARQDSSGSCSGLARQNRQIADLGGNLHAGTCPNGGFTLRAHLPAQITANSQ